MLRILLIVTIVAAVHSLCASPARATCGDYLHTSTQAEPSTVGQYVPAHEQQPGRCLSCQDSPDRPLPTRTPVTVQTVVDPAALGTAATFLGGGERNEWPLCDEVAAQTDPERIDRPPRVC